MKRTLTVILSKSGIRMRTNDLAGTNPSMSTRAVGKLLKAHVLASMGIGDEPIDKYQQ